MKIITIERDHSIIAQAKMLQPLAKSTVMQITNAQFQVTTVSLCMPDACILPHPKDKGLFPWIFKSPFLNRVRVKLYYNLKQHISRKTCVFPLTLLFLSISNNKNKDGLHKQPSYKACKVQSVYLLV